LPLDEGTAIGLGDVAEPKEPTPDASRVKLEISLFGGGMNIPFSSQLGREKKEKEETKSVPPKAFKLMHSIVW
jgi:hypothetical protein